MAKLRQIHEHLHTTEKEFDKPKPGDVRVERAVDRDPKTGEVKHALYRHKATGRELSTRALADLGVAPSPAEFELVRPTVYVHEVYKFQTRPDAGEHGRFFHRDEDDLDLKQPHFQIMGARWDENGFLVGNVMENGVFKSNPDGSPVVDRVRKFANDEAFLPVDKADTPDQAHRLASKHVGE